MTRTLPLLAALALAAPAGAQAVSGAPADAPHVVRLSDSEAAAVLDAVREAEPLVDGLRTTVAVLAASDEVAGALRSLRADGVPVVVRLSEDGTRVERLEGGVSGEVADIVRRAAALRTGEARIFRLSESVDTGALADAVRALAASWTPSASLQADVGAEASDGPAPSVLQLDAVWPNPASGEVAVRYAVPEAGGVRVAVYDALGREVAVVADGPVSAGTHRARLDVSGWGAGTYVVRVTAPGGTATQTFAVVR